MTHPWIVCEQGNRWLPALRAHLRRQSGHDLPALVQVRHLHELSTRIAQSPNSLALLEVSSRNFEAALEWIAYLPHSMPQTRVIALLDHNLSNLADAESVLREAGVLEVVDSPRRLKPALKLGRLVDLLSHSTHDRPNGELPESAQEWADTVLPWQASRRPLG